MYPLLPVVAISVGASVGALARWAGADPLDLGDMEESTVPIADGDV